MKTPNVFITCFTVMLGLPLAVRFLRCRPLGYLPISLIAMVGTSICMERRRNVE